MKRLISVAVALLAVLSVSAQDAVPAPAAPATPIDSVSEAVGTMFGTYVRRSLNDLGMMGVGIERRTFLTALTRAIDGEPGPMDVAAADAFMQRHIEKIRRLMEERMDTLSTASQLAYVDSVATSTEGAVRTPDGTVLIVLTEGEGAMPVRGDTVDVLYTGRLADGTLFDSTESPISFEAGTLVEGFNQGLEMMKPGGRYRLVIPPGAAYGPQGIPGVIPGNAALDFTVELLNVNPKPNKQ